MITANAQLVFTDPQYSLVDEGVEAGWRRVSGDTVEQIRFERPPMTTWEAIAAIATIVSPLGHPTPLQVVQAVESQAAQLVHVEKMYIALEKKYEAMSEQLKANGWTFNENAEITWKPPVNRQAARVHQQNVELMEEISMLKRQNHNMQLQVTSLEKRVSVLIESLANSKKYAAGVLQAIGHRCCINADEILGKK